MTSGRSSPLQGTVNETVNGVGPVAQEPLVGGCAVVTAVAAMVMVWNIWVIRTQLIAGMNEIIKGLRSIDERLGQQRDG